MIFKAALKSSGEQHKVPSSRYRVLMDKSGTSLFISVMTSVARCTEYFRIFGKNGQVFGIRKKRSSIRNSDKLKEISEFL